MREVKASHNSAYSFSSKKSWLIFQELTEISGVSKLILWEGWEFWQKLCLAKQAVSYWTKTQKENIQEVEKGTDNNNNKRVKKHCLGT